MLRVGQRLYEERIKRGLSVEDVAKATKIRSQFIIAIEKGDYLRLPSSAYVQGFVKNYISFLGLPSKHLLALLRREFDEREFLTVLPKSFTEKKEIRFSGIRIQQLAFVFIFLIFLAFGYLLFQYRAAFINPSLSIQLPKEHAIIVSQIVSIEGSTDTNSIVTVNGIPVFIDTNGHFRKDLQTFSGKSIINIQAVNNFGRKTVIERHILVR